MPNMRDHNRRLIKFARNMRHEPTDAERKTWSLLRGKRLNGYKFRRQHPIAGYILDFFCMQKDLAIELDGGQHNDPEVVAYDKRRSDKLASLGIRILRFWDHEILKESDAVLDTICNTLEPSPQPSPGVPGEGV